MEKKSEKLVSRKGAKHVLSSNVEGAAKKLNFRTWRLGAINFLAIRVLNVHVWYGVNRLRR